MAADDAERAVRSHQNSYSLFVALMKYGTIISVIVAALVILIISN